MAVFRAVFVPLAAALLDEFARGGADADAQDLRLADAFAADGGVAFGKRQAEADGVVHGFHGAAVVADEAVVAGVGVGGDADAEQQFEELAGVAAGVTHGDAADADARVGGGIKRGKQGGDGFGFVVFDAEVDGVCAEDARGDLCATDDGGGVFADLQVVAGDVGLAFGSVDDEGVGGVAEFARSGETRPAEADDAAVVDARAQFVRRGGLNIEGRQRRRALVFTVACEDEVRHGTVGRVHVRARLDGADSTGGGGVDGGVPVIRWRREKLAT